jgi:hypothetical protein
MQFIREFRKAQTFQSKPIFIHGAFYGSFADVFEDWMVAADSFNMVADIGTDDTYQRMLKKSTGWRGYGKYPMLVNPDDATFTASVLAAQRLGTFMVAGPCNIQWLNTNNLTSSMVNVMTNDEFRAIWRDPLGAPGWLVSSNTVGEVWARRMGNGDLAIAFINLTGSASSLTVTWNDLKIAPTNTLMLGRDVFERTNVVVGSQYTRSIRAREGSLFRFTPVNSAGRLYGTGSPESAVAAPVGWTYQRLDGTGATYTKTNGTDRTGWYNNLERL